MASIDAFAPVAPRRRRGFLARLLAAFRRGQARAALDAKTERDIAAVRAMSDQLLRDIGLTRGDIEFTVRTGRLPDR